MILNSIITMNNIHKKRHIELPMLHCKCELYIGGNKLCVF